MAKYNEDFFKNEGIAIFVKGNMMIGIDPENLESNTKALNNGDVKIDWEYLLSKANGFETDKGAHDLVKSCVSVKNKNK